MKSIFKKLAGVVMGIALVFCTTGCSNGSSDGSSDYSSCAAGDFILKDGSVLSKDSTPASGSVAAVIVRAAGGGKPALGVGINHTTRAWCTSTTAGYTTNIGALQGDKNSGYMDGRDSWEKLKAACSDAVAHPEYYPAWNYCRNYGSANGLTGDMANEWYLPTVAELYTVYQNNTAVIDASLAKAGGNQFGSSCYWSCSQAAGEKLAAQSFIVREFLPGANWDKSCIYFVCAVKAFY